jgi:LuxR family maltose regulon positive regulatory protein
MSDQGQTLLQTKLHQTGLPRNLVVRSRLVERLNQATDHQLTLVCAPAGFGKTTLVCTWLERVAAGLPTTVASARAGWLSLDETDSDLSIFLRYFIAALGTIFNEPCPQTLDLIQAQQQPPEEIIYATFINELEGLSGEAILVLDDYHTIRGTEVHNLLSELVRHWPKPLHLVMISRTIPPIPLTSLRAKGKLMEIRSQDLRFTPEETATYLSQARIAPLRQPDLHILEERVEGWPAGIHLASLSLRSIRSKESVLSVLSNKNTNITAYLVEEVLANQFPEIQSFLLKTSILDRFCAALCEAVIGEIDTSWNVRACLDWIERSELFLIPLDDRREWYRYHHLFQELLQQRAFAELGPDQVNNLHLRASAWFAEHGLIDEALDHALAAGDLDLAARQMSAGLREALNHGERLTLERWLRLLPEEMIQRRPELLMIRAWAQQFMWQFDLQAEVLQQIEELLNADGNISLTADILQILRGQILTLKAQYAYFDNQPLLAIDLCKQALMLLPSSWVCVRGGGMLYLGMSMQTSGHGLAAERLLLDEYGASNDKNDIYPLMLLQTLGYIYINSGQLERVRQVAQLQIQGAVSSKDRTTQSWGDYYLGVLHYQRNELGAAAQHFSFIIKNRYTAQITTYREAIAGLALIHQIQGESSEAWQMVESISQIDLEQRGSEDERTRSLRARLQLLQGDLEGAGQWADTFTDPPPDQALMWLEEPQVTRARILVARGTDADLQSALQILDILKEIVDRTHNTRYKIEILALRAVALDAQGETGQADTTLMQALDLARPGGFIRVFVDLGKPMYRMLRRLVKQGHSVQTINHILSAFPEDDKDLATRARYPSPGSSSLVEPLTPRELEILALLRGPSSVKEIALKLNVSHATVKGHTINLYAKLGVNRRWDAVAKAEELNILPPR